MVNFFLALLDFILSPILSVLDFPAVPAELSALVNQVFSYMKSAMGIINFFVPLSLIAPAIVVFFAVFTIMHSYSLLLWVLKKVPMVGIE